MAQLYQDDDVVKQDLIKAANYYEKLVTRNYKDSREQLTAIIETLEQSKGTLDEIDVTDEKLANFQQSLDMEIITVNSSKSLTKDSLTASLNRFKLYSNKYNASTGSRIKGKPCGSTAYSCKGLSGDDLEDEMDATGNNF